MSMRRIVALLLGSLILLGGMSLAPTTAEAKTTCPKDHGSGNQYPPGQCKGKVSKSEVHPGQPLTVGADGFPAGAVVEFTLHSAPVSLGTATADAAGHVSKAVTIPTTTSPGQHSISMYDSVSGRYVSVAITVAGSPISGGVAENAVTTKSAGSGMGLTALLIVGVGVLALAVLGFFFIGRRRSTPASS